jgi:hypothetical protein
LRVLDFSVEKPRFLQKNLHVGVDVVGVGVVGITSLASVGVVSLISSSITHSRPPGLVILAGNFFYEAPPFTFFAFFLIGTALTAVFILPEVSSLCRASTTRSMS